MLLFIDYEHADRYGTKFGSRIQAARTWITYRLEDLSGRHCMLVRYDRVTPELVAKLGARALFISGNSADPSQYEPALIQPLHSLVRESGLPVFGFCGGFQLLAEALGSDVVPLDVGVDPVETDTLVKFDGDRFGEVGYHEIELLGSHPLVEGLGPAPVFRHAHGLHVPDPPGGFEVLARTEITPVQLAVDDDRRLVGTQFHPEYWTDEHPAGQTLIENFLRWADLV